MSFFSTIKFITSHPLNKANKFLALARFFKWQINNLINPYAIIYQFTEKCKLIIKKGMTGASGNLYCGLFDYQEMYFLLHFLRKEDLFLDIGSNIGSYTILASGHVGSNSIAFEPVPSTFKNLLNNIAINDLKNVQALNIAIGSSKGEISFTKDNDTTNHVATNDEQNVIKVKVDKLDDILEGEKMPSLIKVDVEGYETEVINGACKTLKSEELKAIIIELNGSGNRYNFDESLIHKKLIEYGFIPYLYNPLNRSLIKLSNYGNYNTIYIREKEYVLERLKSAISVKVLNQNI